VITISDAEYVHEISIDQFGGGTGIRDKGALDAALARPFQTFDGNELYDSVLEKAAALIESILINHPFVDGNKRTGYLLMRLLLMDYGSDIEATEDDKYDFVVEIASGKKSFDENLLWLIAKTIPMQEG
jgi:death-on-curing protein